MAVDNRQKNFNWTTCSDRGSTSFDGAQLAVLMDIRDELQTLNRLLGCHNFTRIPSVLDAIARSGSATQRNTAWSRKRKALTRRK